MLPKDSYSVIADPLDFIVRRQQQFASLSRTLARRCQTGVATVEKTPGCRLLEDEIFRRPEKMPGWI